ncbi:hypothetical protein KPH14_008688 [Odynerus spinipes]|uniref:Uncharacterized protein n=1 Tax=Odynerus spinipes TaxID=1348599 RepID=A0AAD9RHD2_9HYME|nr:hypothetical protein KPH14_008688 [Odynerus spinipes]
MHYTEIVPHHSRLASPPQNSTLASTLGATLARWNQEMPRSIVAKVERCLGGSSSSGGGGGWSGRADARMDFTEV